MLRKKTKNNHTKVVSTNGKGRSEKLKFILHILVGVLVCSTIIFSIFYGKKTPGVRLHPGDIALRNIYSPYDFKYLQGIDEEETRRLKEDAANKVYLVYDVDAQSLNNIKQIVQTELSLMKNPDTQTSSLKERIDPSFQQFFKTDKIEELQKKIEGLFDEIYASAVLYEREINSLVTKGIDTVSLRNSPDQSEKLFKVKDIYTVDSFNRERKNLLIKKHFPDSWKFRKGAAEVITSFLGPTIRYNEVETLNRKARAMDKVSPVYKYLEVKKNEVIIKKGERVTSEQIETLNILSLGQSRYQRYLLFVGICVLVSILTFMFILYLRIFKPGILKDNRYILLLGIITVLIASISRIITLSGFSPYFIPVAAGAMLVALLIDDSVAMVSAVMLAIISGFIAGNSLNIIVVTILGGISAVYSIRKVRIRAHILRSGLLVGMTQFFAIFALGMISGHEVKALSLDALRGFAGGLFASILVAGLFLQLFEHMFKITTNISLLELADLNHPLLKDLIVRAPGTYHHSLLVGNLAEAACESVEANSLLARVAGYFHDIGKIEMSEYFAENQPLNRESKHHKLAPTMSALIIIKHVKAGLELANKYRLPKTIKDFIPQHHGTSLVSYFYQRAIQKAKPEEEDMVSEQSFRYAGPKPQSKEAAIVLLADSVEAASRSLEEPTPASLKGLVRKIINNKFIDGQLDECDLTLKDLHKIADTFLRVLTGIYHSRIEYPDMEKNQKNKKQEDLGNENSKDEGNAGKNKEQSEKTQN